jgi:predicted RNA methylase
VSIDLGTGDGRLPYTLAARGPERLFVGVDANAAAMRAVSSRARRAGMSNVLYVRAAVESLPEELRGVADRVTVVLPWGSLLAAVARPDPSLLPRVRDLCRPGAFLSVVLAIHPERDRAELRRLGLPTLDEAHLEGDLPAGFATAGFRVTRVRGLSADELAQWPSTWARKLAHGRPRPVFQVDAVASGGGPSSGPLPSQGRGALTA